MHIKSKKLRINFLYVLSEGFKNIITNRLMSVASIGVLVSCIIIMGSFLLAVINVNVNLTDIEKMNEIVVFIDANVNEKELNDIGEQIKYLKYVESVEYVSKEEAFERLKERFKDKPSALTGLEKDNPLRRSYEIVMADISKTDVTVSNLVTIKGIVNIRANKEVAQVLVNFRHVLTVAATWFVGILFAISLFIIVNTIRITVHSRETEINIMKYVGATNWFIRWPFIIEGLSLGILSALIAYALQWYIYTYVVSKIFNDIGNIIKIVEFSSVNGRIIGAFLLTGAIVGAIGSGFAVGRYLKV